MMATARKSVSTSRIAKPVDVDGYIAAAPPAVRAELRALRAAIRTEAPHATEKMSYGIPFYEYGGKPGTLASRLVYFAAHKDHIAVYPAGDAKGLPCTPLVVTARFDGSAPAEATLVMRYADGKETRLPMARRLADPPKACPTGASWDQILQPGFDGLL